MGVGVGSDRCNVNDGVLEGEEMSGQVESSFTVDGYWAYWKTGHLQGNELFDLPVDALEKIGFEYYGENRYEFGRAPVKLKRRTARRGRAHGRNSSWLIIALTCIAVGFVFGRNERWKK